MNKLLFTAFLLFPVFSYAGGFSPLEIDDSSNQEMSSTNGVRVRDYPSQGYYYSGETLLQTGYSSLDDMFSYSPLFRNSTPSLFPGRIGSTLMLNGNEYGRDSNTYIALILKNAPLKSIRGVEISDSRSSLTPGNYGVVNIQTEDGRKERSLYINCEASGETKITPSLTASFPGDRSSYSYSAMYGYSPGRMIYVADKDIKTQPSPKGKDAYLQFSSAGFYGRYLVRTDLIYAYGHLSDDARTESELLNCSFNAKNELNNFIKQELSAGIIKGRSTIKNENSVYEHQEENAIFLTSSLNTLISIYDLSVFSIKGSYLHSKNTYFYEGLSSEKDFSASNNQFAISAGNSTNIHEYFKSSIMYGYTFEEAGGRTPFFDASVKLSHPSSGAAIHGKTSYSTDTPTTDERLNPLYGTDSAPRLKLFTLSGGLSWHRINLVTSSIYFSRYRLSQNGSPLHEGDICRELNWMLTFTPVRFFVMSAGVNHAIKYDNTLPVPKRKTHLSLGLVSSIASFFINTTESFDGKENINLGSYLSFTFSDYHLYFKSDNLVKRWMRDGTNNRIFKCGAGAEF